MITRRRKGFLILVLICLFSLNLYGSDLDELSKIRNDILQEGLNWTAGETSIFKMPAHLRRQILSRNPPSIERENLFLVDKSIFYSYPSSLDYRNYLGYNWMTPVRDQKDCGSCWAFSTLGSLEAIIKLYNADPDMEIDLSEQELISCTVTGSCAYGGSQLFAANYIKASGVVDEACFPYIAQEGDCKNRCPNPQVREFIKDAGTVGFFSIAGEEEIKAALLRYGPIPSSMKVYSDFYAYKGGVYQKTSSATDEGWHAIVIVGWDDAKNAWICKNSWSEDFGENGYFMIKKGDSFIGWGTEWMIYKDDLKPRFCTDTPSVNVTINLQEKSEEDFQVNIYNCGSWVFEWTTYLTDSYIQISKKTGVAIKKAEVINAKVNASSLPTGTYTTYINFKADGVENSPLTIPVRITVINNEKPDAGIDILIFDEPRDEDTESTYDVEESADEGSLESFIDIIEYTDSDTIYDLSEFIDDSGKDAGDSKDITSGIDTTFFTDKDSDINLQEEGSSSGCSCDYMW